MLACYQQRWPWFFCGTVFQFYFRKAIPRKNRNIKFGYMTTHAGPTLWPALKVFPWDSFSILFSKCYTMEKQKQKYKIWVNDSTLRLALKSFSMGQYFHFIFEILCHGKTHSRSPALAQHLKSFSVAQYFDFMREQYFLFLIFRQYGKSRKDLLCFYPTPYYCVN